MHSPALPDWRVIKAFASLKLTPREAEVLFWISQGKSNHDIGIILGAKTGTICKHVEHILDKLNVENRTSAAVVALETRRSVAEIFESKPGRAWAAVAGVIASQFVQLASVASEIYDGLPALAA
jgi:DNA-binding CsgD family transcriptional regulator